MPDRPPPPTVVWDVDDVLAPTMASWLHQTWTPENPGAPSLGEIVENPPHRLIGVDKETYHRSLDRFRAERYAAMAPYPEVLAFFTEHGHRFRHAALTATPRAHAPTVSRWVLHHFGDWIRTFGFVPSARPDDDPRLRQHPDKGAWLTDFGPVALFVDDSPRNVASARAAGVESWLVKRPWNEGEPIEALLARLAEWPDAR